MNKTNVTIAFVLLSLLSFILFFVFLSELNTHKDNEIIAIGTIVSLVLSIILGIVGKILLDSHPPL